MQRFATFFLQEPKESLETTEVSIADPITEAEEPVDERTTCSHCGREGHSRRTHFNCAMNPGEAKVSD